LSVEGLGLRVEGRGCKIKKPNHHIEALLP
jgi:hypothetical protein